LYIVLLKALNFDQKNSVSHNKIGFVCYRLAWPFNRTTEWNKRILINKI
jgi:hypothetical protein